MQYRKSLVSFTDTFRCYEKQLQFTSLLKVLSRTLHISTVQHPSLHQLYNPFYYYTALVALGVMQPIFFV